MAAPPSPFCLHKEIWPATKPSIQSIKVDQRTGIFTVVFDDGFRVYGINPFTILPIPIDSVAPVQVSVQLANKDYCDHNCVSLVKELKIKVCVFGTDDNLSMEILMPDKVRVIKTVKMWQDFVLVLTGRKMLVYRLWDPTLYRSILVLGNPNDFELSGSEHELIFAFISFGDGRVRVNYEFDSFNIIHAFDSTIDCLGISVDGNSIACLSRISNCIKVFDSHSLQIRHELTVSLALHKNPTMALSLDCIAVSSEKGLTVCDINSNQAHFTLPEGFKHVALSFGPTQFTFSLICGNGCLYNLKFDPSTVNMKLVGFQNFMEMAS